MKSMKVGDLLTSVDGESRGSVLVVLEIVKNSENSDRDRIWLQWMPRNGGRPIQGSLSRHMVEKKYKVV